MATPRSPRSTKRQKQAAAAFAATVEALKSQMHPGDVTFEPSNFASWMMLCDTGSDQLVLTSLVFVERALKSAAGGPASVYVQLRRHYLDYATAAMTLRWPDHPSLNLKPAAAGALVDDDIPF